MKVCETNEISHQRNDVCNFEDFLLKRLRFPKQNWALIHFQAGWSLFYSKLSLFLLVLLISVLKLISLTLKFQQESLLRDFGFRNKIPEASGGTVTSLSTLSPWDYMYSNDFANLKCSSPLFIPPVNCSWAQNSCSSSIFENTQSSWVISKIIDLHLEYLLYEKILHLSSSKNNFRNLAQTVRFNEMYQLTSITS